MRWGVGDAGDSTKSDRQPGFDCAEGVYAAAEADSAEAGSAEADSAEAGSTRGEGAVGGSCGFCSKANDDD
jgi:hypothetical protein